MSSRAKKRESSASSLKFKDSKKGRQKENEPPESFMEINDDEAEKMERRKSRLFAEPPETPANNQTGKAGRPSSPTSLQNKRKSLALSNLKRLLAPDEGDKEQESGTAKAKTPKMALSNEQLSALYANCIKLSTENKINQKNAWELNLIENFDDVLVVQNEAAEMTNFQVASCTLDASVKIYSCRVDSVHGEVFKVLGGLNMTSVEQEKEEVENAENKGDEKENEQQGENVEQAKVQKKAKKIHVGGVNTLETNMDNITAKNFDMAFDVDPLFKKTSASFDEGGARGLLLNQLSVYNNCELIFDSSDAADMIDTKQTEGSEPCDIADLQRKLLNITSDLTPLEICPIYSNFQFSKADKKEDDNDQEADFEPFSDDDVPDVVPGFMGEDIDGLDDDVQQKEANLMEELLAQDDEDAEPVAVAHTPKSKKDAEMPFFVTLDNDFEYFDPKMLDNWAGPNHWKFRAPPKEVGEGQIKKKSKGKKEPFFINFEDEKEVDPIAFAAGKGTTMSAAKKAAIVDNSLPPDVHYDIRMLTQLFNKPRWRVSLQKRRRLENQDDTDVPAFLKGRDNNADDAADFDMGPVGDRGSDDEGGDIFIPPPAITDEMELVNAPRKVEQIKINYVKTAKMVDVKALKDSLWSGIHSKDKKDMEEPKSFSSLIAQLPEKMPEEALANVNVSFCFICLLHLANEKGLTIEQEKGDLTELYIKPEK